MRRSGARERAYALLVASLRIDPSFVNAYAALAELLDGHGEDTYHELQRAWREHGSGDPQGLSFVEQYRHGDPASSLADWCERRKCGPALIVRVGDDAEFLDLYDYSGVSGQLPAFVGRVRDPNLICSPRDFGRLPAAKQAIAEDLVKRGKDFRVVSHRGTTVALTSRAVFGPTIDSLYFNATLHRTVYRSIAAQRAVRVAEVGVGSGFLLCSLVQALPQRPLQVVGSDVDPSALATTRRNVEHTLAQARSPQAVHVTLEQDANLLERLPSNQVELLISNPPYIPECRPTSVNAYSGTKLIESLITQQAPRVLAPGGVAVVLYSSLAASMVQASLQHSPLVAVSLGPGRRVPLDLREVGSDPSWIEMLLRDHGLEQTLDDPAHAYWHTLQIIALCRRDDGALIDELKRLAAENGAR